MTIRPVRLQLRRTKGFNLQALSRSLNGLAAVNCARPSKWGNPFSVAGFGRAQAVALHRTWIDGTVINMDDPRAHNLACWCTSDAPCHTDTLLELANP